MINTVLCGSAKSIVYILYELSNTFVQANTLIYNDNKDLTTSECILYSVYYWIMERIKK